MKPTELVDILLNPALSLAEKVRAYEEYRKGLLAMGFANAAELRTFSTRAIALELKRLSTQEARRLKKSLAKVKEKWARLAARIHAVEPGATVRVGSNGHTSIVTFLGIQGASFVARFPDRRISEVAVSAFVDVVDGD